MTDEFIPIPETAEALAAKWARVDALYAQATSRLSPDSVAAVRDARMKEAGRLPNKDERARMWAQAKSWVQPVGQDFGGMRDWLDG